MQYLVDTYRCEWADVVKDPLKRARFRHFANSAEKDENVALVEERGQKRPREWVKDKPAVLRDRLHLPLIQTSWVKVGRVEDFPKDAAWRFATATRRLPSTNSARAARVACQNMCPHMRTWCSPAACSVIRRERRSRLPQHKKTFR
jgi:nitrite reductase (NADH) large subunit